MVTNGHHKLEPSTRMFLIYFVVGVANVVVSGKTNYCVLEWDMAVSYAAADH